MRKIILKTSLIAMLGFVACGNDFCVMASEEVSAGVISDPGAENKQAVQRIVAKMQEHIGSGYYYAAAELMSNYVYAKGDSLKALFPSVLEDLGLGNPLDDNNKNHVEELFRYLGNLSLRTSFRDIAEDELLKIATDDLDYYQKMDNTNVNHEFMHQRALAAALAGSVKVLKYMVENSKLRYDSDLFTAALVGGNQECVRFCIQKGLDKTWSFECFRGEGFIKDNLVLELINQGKELDEYVANRFLLPVSAGGRLNFVKYLVEECHADVEAKYKLYKRTPIHYASEWGHLDVVKYLHEQCHADVEIKDRFGYTPLILASSNGHLEVVKYLVEECLADVEAKDNDGRTPLIIASGCWHLDVVKYLHEECHAKITNDAINNVWDREIREYLLYKKAEQAEQAK